MSWKSAFKSNQKFSVINLLIDENGFIELENLAILFATTLLLATLIVGCGLSLPPILKLGMILASPCLFMAGMFNAAAHRANNDNLWVHVNINSAIINRAPQSILMFFFADWRVLLCQCTELVIAVRSVQS